MFGCKEMDIATLQGLQKEGSVALVDVRTDAEVARGVIEGAKHIPLHMLPIKAQELDLKCQQYFIAKRADGLRKPARLWPLRAMRMFITYKVGLWRG